MIQRKQTIFLLLALLVLIVCLSLPIGQLEPKGMGVAAMWYNLGMYRDGAFQAMPIPFADLVVVGVLTFTGIFLYKHRLVQARLCVVNVVLCLAWYAYYGFNVLHQFPNMGTFHYAYGACLPFVAIILFLMARRGIMADERLVKSMDRIR